MRPEQRGNVVLFPGRDGAAGDHHVETRRRVRQRDRQPAGIVRQGRPRDRLQSFRAQQPHQQLAVGVVDFAGLQRRARLHQFVAGGEYRHRGPRRHRQAGKAQRGRQRHLHRIQPGACGQHRIARLRVLARPAHVGASADTRRHGDRIALHLQLFAHHHGIRARGHRGASGDPDAFAGVHAQAKRATGVLLADQVQYGVGGCGQVGVAAGNAVHRAVVEWLQRDRRDDIPRQHAPMAARDGDLLQGQAPGLGDTRQQRKRLVEGDAGREVSHALCLRRAGPPGC